MQTNAAKVATLVPEPDSVSPFKGPIIRRENKADTGTQELGEANGESTCLAPGPGQRGKEARAVKCAGFVKAALLLILRSEGLVQANIT